MSELIILLFFFIGLTLCSICAGIYEGIERKEKRRKAYVKFWQISQEIEKERKGM